MQNSLLIESTSQQEDTGIQGDTGGTGGYTDTRIQEATRGYWRIRRIQEDTIGYRRIQEDIGGYRRIQEDTEEYTGGYRRIQEDT